ncbi:ComEC family competence protein [Microbacteriaceae bacterium K1510]|nr:ComEC family competence protein [Microbacteriaceae bacterium K1510]
MAGAIAAAGSRAGAALPDGVAVRAGHLRQLLAQWALAELAPGRLLPWLPVAFGFGIVLYFTADREPVLWASAAAAVALVALAYGLRRSAIGFPVSLGLAAMAVGFAVATAQTARMAHPVLQYPVATATLSGFVEVREERERSDRVVIALHRFEAARVAEKPERVRVAVRKDTAPPVGAFVELKAHLSPPLAPLRPGGYDFARDMYFQRIGASGYALGAIRTAPAPAAQGFWLRYAAVVQGIRETIDDRIRAILPGDRGAIASALITGKRDAISTPVNDAMYVSSLAHVLSISGYHMAVVAGIVFFVIRAGLALSPSLAVRRPIKKWAACGALVAAFFYLLLSGVEVATQRSFIMVAIVLIGVMADRPAITFRTLTVAALCVLAWSPQAVVHPSFQMSFAATLALVAAYQVGLPWRPNADTPIGARIALWGGREVAGLILASLVAGFATTLYAAFHFHRVAPYGVLANLLAMPVVSVLVMPMGILALVLMPFGFDAVFWRLMGAGIDWMTNVALWVASLPGAVGHIHAFGAGPLLTGTAGLLLVCLLRSPLRWSGAVLGAFAVLWVLVTPRPDVLVAADGQTAAIRNASGRLSLLHSGRDTFALKEWLAADGDERTVTDKTLKDGVRCDAIGCVGALGNGRLVAASLAVEAFTEDCARAAVVVSPRQAPGPCKAALIDRARWRSDGAVTLRWNGDAFETTAARPVGYERPWARGPQTTVVPQSTTSRPAPRDATPRSEDLEASD